MARRKKKSHSARAKAWLKARPKLLAAIIILILCLTYLPVHAYHAYADNRKFSQTHSAMDKVYSDITDSLGQPDNIKRTDSCFKTSSFGSSYSCTAKTEFIYGLTSQSQADFIIARVQKIVTGSKLFRPTGKLSKGITDSLVFDNYYHDALDRFSGPHHIPCSMKYSFNTPDEVDLSLNSPSALPFEIFFACTAGANHAVYPTI